MIRLLMGKLPEYKKKWNVRGYGKPTGVALPYAMENALKLISEKHDKEYPKVIRMALDSFLQYYELMNPDFDWPENAKPGWKPVEEKKKNKNQGE